MTDTVIITEKISKAYFLESGPAPGNFWALKDVSFQVKQGEVIGLIGRNGAGKSTLLKVLSKITQPTGGRAVLRGRIASLLEVGTGFHPDLSGRENVFLNGAILGMKKNEIQKRFDEIVEFSALENFIDAPVKHYSSGMYMRLAFSVAAHLNSEILFVDEVLSVGDVSFQKKCLEKVESVAQRGKTVFFTSHNLSAVKSLTSRCLLLEKGRLVMDGQSGKVIDQYLEIFAHQENSESVMVRECPELKREVEFERFELLKVKGIQIVEGAPLNFRVSLKSDQGMNFMRLSMTIYQGEMPVGSLFGPQTMSVEKGKSAVYEVEITDLQLTPGRYHCIVAVGQGDYQTGEKNFDVVRNVLHFEVVENFSEPSLYPRWKPGWGAIKFKTPQVKKVR